MPTPLEPKLYHIVHVGNLQSIVRAGCLWCDAVVRSRQDVLVIGMSGIKERRQTLPVSCHSGTMVGDYVPFYFCPRSIMLYVIHRANHPELSYRGGQGPIVHLQADLYAVVAWATANRRRWAFSASNAAARYASFWSGLGELGRVDWSSVTARDFSSAEVKEGKQAEFLFESDFPWNLVERVGVHSREVGRQVHAAMAGAAHRPPVEVMPTWYY